MGQNVWQSPNGTPKIGMHKDRILCEYMPRKSHSTKDKTRDSIGCDVFTCSTESPVCTG